MTGIVVGLCVTFFQYVSNSKFSETEAQQAMQKQFVNDTAEIKGLLSVELQRASGERELLKQSITTLEKTDDRQDRQINELSRLVSKKELNF